MHTFGGYLTQGQAVCRSTINMKYLIFVRINSQCFNIGNFGSVGYTVHTNDRVKNTVSFISENNWIENILTGSVEYMVKSHFQA